MKEETNALRLCMNQYSNPFNSKFNAWYAPYADKYHVKELEELNEKKKKSIPVILPGF